jgi:hypothetical protein
LYNIFLLKLINNRFSLHQAPPAPLSGVSGGMEKSVAGEETEANEKNLHPDYRR